MARRGTPLAKKVVCRSAFWTAHRFDERRPCACTSLPGENYSAGGLTGCLTYIKRIKDTVIRQDLSRKIIQSYRGWIAIKRRFYIYYTTDCAIELSIIRYKIRWPLPVRSADSNKRKETVSPDLSVRQLDRAILSLPAQMFSNSISTYPLAIRLLVISTPFPTSLPGFIPSVTALPSPTRRKINSKNSARSIGPSPGKEANLYVHALDRYRPNFSRLALFATRPRNELPNSRFRSKQGRGSSRMWWLVDSFGSIWRRSYPPFLRVTTAQKPESFTNNVNFEGKFALENKRYEIGWRLDQI